MGQGNKRIGAPWGKVRDWIKAALRQSGRLLRLPQHALYYVVAKWRGQQRSRRMARSARQLRLRPDSLQLLLQACRRMGRMSSEPLLASSQRIGSAMEAASELGAQASMDAADSAALSQAAPGAAQKSGLADRRHAAKHRSLGAARGARGRHDGTGDEVNAKADQAGPGRGGADESVRPVPEWSPHGSVSAEARLRRERELCSEQETELLHSIQERTARCNRNNVTRTQAYWDMYRRHPELHWALLAHMVSRNGGWNMTDLQGGLLPGLLSWQQREDTFWLLERANAFIFGDAYPQLLLYEAGKRAGRDLSYLLPALGVSRFMFPAWRIFWRDRDAALLTVSLIINEQHYIERRVVQHPELSERVVQASFFELQSLLQLNQVIFPYAAWPQPLRLAGLILENFGHLEERIEFGKQLYALLFAVPEVHQGVVRFARAVRHSGSRADYAPHLFAPGQAEGAGSNGGEASGAADRRQDAGRLILSPMLSQAWPDRPLERPVPGDWFAGLGDVERHLTRLSLPPSFEMTNEYGFGLSKLKLAAAAARSAGWSQG